MSDTGADYVLVLESESLSIPIFGKWGRTAVLVITRKRGLSPFFSRSPFEAYFTLSRNENQILVDCIYASIRNEQNGILINKAVCGLSRPLVEGYEDTVYEFSDQWKSETASVSIAPVLKIPPMSLEVKEAEIGSAELFRIYKDKKDLSTSVPKAILRSGIGKYSFGSSLVFSVYNVGALTAPFYIDVLVDGLAKKFVRYDRGAVEKLF